MRTCHCLLAVLATPMCFQSGFRRPFAAKPALLAMFGMAAVLHRHFLEIFIFTIQKNETFAGTSRFGIVFGMCASHLS